MKDNIVKPANEAPAPINRPGMMGDGTQEQNLNQTGDPTARVTLADVEATFNPPDPKKT